MHRHEMALGWVFGRKIYIGNFFRTFPSIISTLLKYGRLKRQILPVFQIFSKSLVIFSKYFWHFFLNFAIFFLNFAICNFLLFPCAGRARIVGQQASHHRGAASGGRALYVRVGRHRPVPVAGPAPCGRVPAERPTHRCPSPAAGRLAIIISSYGWVRRYPRICQILSFCDVVVVATVSAQLKEGLWWMTGCCKI